MVKALKFGGTSMANAKSIQLVANIIKNDPNARYIVVSAPGKREKNDTKVTDLLIQLHEAKLENKKEIMDKIKERFEEIVKDLNISLDLNEEYERILQNEIDGASYSYTVSRGEYLSARILSKYINFKFIDSIEFIRFDENGLFNAELSNSLGEKILLSEDFAIIPGFYGANELGEVITFSRGGSDITGAIVARAVKASIYENWTDVNGFKVCDPRIVPNSKQINILTYKELRELSYMGASVLHSEAVFPVSKAKIPINIKNTFEPENPGTLIVNLEDLISHKYTRDDVLITGIAGKKDFITISIEKVLMDYDLGFRKTIFDILYENKVILEHLPTGIDTLNMIIKEIPEETLEKIVRELTKKLNPDNIEVEKNISLIAVVGHGMNKAKGTAEKVCKALSNNNINIRMIDQGSSELNIIIGVENKDYEGAIKSLYTEFFGQ